MIECRNLVKKYTNLNAVDDVTISLEEGKIYVLLGPNGSGKTTLMKILAGLTKQTDGELFVDGKEPTAETKQLIAYMPTENYLYGYMNCIDAGKYYQDFFNDFSMDKYMSLLSEMELDPKTRIAKMSSGMVAKTKVALTLARQSKLIMLDEPLNGIDIIARDKIIHTIISAADENKIILVSSHLVDELEKVVDNAIFLKNGKLVIEGNAEELRENQGKSIVEMYKEIYA